MAFEDDIVDFFKCPLSFEMLVDPVRAGPEPFIAQG